MRRSFCIPISFPDGRGRHPQDAEGALANALFWACLGTSAFAATAATHQSLRPGRCKGAILCPVNMHWSKTDCRCERNPCGPHLVCSVGTTWDPSLCRCEKTLLHPYLVP